MSIPTLASNSIDHLLNRAVQELALRFTGLFNVQTIDRYVHESYQSLYRTATIKTYLPNLAARFATDRLTALAQATGRLDKPVPEVLLVCVHNARRSQMAAALLDRAANGRIHVRSAGSLPAGEVNPAVIDAMAEIGLDLSQEFPKPLTDDVVRAADVVITMGCGDACPIYPGKRYLDWTLDDPDGQTLDVIRDIRDEIDRRVQQLLNELVPVA